jgi:hypothetical protein
MRAFQLFVAICLSVSANALAADDESFLVEALLARVGDDVIQLSDLRRYKSVEAIMQCINIRLKTPGLDKESAKASLQRYIDEELIYIDAKSKQASSSSDFEEIIRKIKRFPSCSARWKSLGERYASIWNQKAGSLTGETMLVRELEKRLMIDQHVREKIGNDLRSWLQEARVRVPVKYFAD